MPKLSISQKSIRTYIVVSVVMISVALLPFYFATDIYSKSNITNADYLSLIDEQDILKMSFERTVQNKADLEPWKNNLQAKLAELIDIKFPVESYNYEVTSIDQREGYTIQHIQYNNIPASLMIPNDLDTLMPAVLILAGHSYGIETITAETNLESHPDGQLGIGKFLVQRGYIVLAPELDTLGSRSKKIAAGRQTNLHDHYGNFLTMTGRSLIGIQVQDALISAKILRSLKQVDPSRTGVLGLSTGSHVSFITAALDPEIKVAHSASGVVATLKSQFWLTFSEFQHDQIPGLLEWADQPDIAGLISPRPFLMTYGIGEASPYGKEAVDHDSYEYMLPIYNLYETPENLVLRIYRGNHRYDLNAVLEFLDKYL